MTRLAEVVPGLTDELVAIGTAFPGLNEELRSGSVPD